MISKSRKVIWFSIFQRQIAKVTFESNWKLCEAIMVFICCSYGCKLLIKTSKTSIVWFTLMLMLQTTKSLYLFAQGGLRASGQGPIRNLYTPNNCMNPLRFYEIYLWNYYETRKLNHEFHLIWPVTLTSKVPLYFFSLLPGPLMILCFFWLSLHLYFYDPALLFTPLFLAPKQPLLPLFPLPALLFLFRQCRTGTA